MELIPTALTTFAAAMAGASIKGAKGPAQALDDIMELVGFDKLHLYAEKKRAKNEALIRVYKEKIAQELANIPEENIQEPQLAIVGPAIEASKFYIEEETLRDMFAKLVASSMDSRKSKYARSAFVEIIKQMNPVDAQSLRVIFESEGFQGAVAQIRMHIKPSEYFITHTNLFLDNPFEKNQEILGQSLDNLARLGLIEIDYTQFCTDQALYDRFKEIEEYRKQKIMADEQNRMRKSSEAMKKAGYSGDISKIPKIKNVDINKGLVRLTLLGKAFCSTCL